MYIKVELTREEALEVLKRGSALNFADLIEESDDFIMDQFVSDTEMYDYGLALVRDKVVFMDDGMPQMYASPILKKKEMYYTNDLEAISGNEEEMLNILLLEEMKTLPKCFHQLDHQTRFFEGAMEVGCQNISKENAIDIAKHILDYYGE